VSLASVDPGPHLYWLSSRAAGTAAMLLASTAVFVGVLRAGGLAGSQVRGGRRRLELAIIHEALGIATIIAVVIHGFVLIGDDFYNWTVVDVIVPFVAPFKPTQNGVGIIAGYLFVVLSLTYYLRDRIGESTWTVMHRFVLLAWAGSIVHTLGVATDKHKAWFIVVLVLPIIANLVVLVLRLVGVLRRPQPAA
jgi:sulfoxide reductase heme-binding subunit YedZ